MVRNTRVGVCGRTWNHTGDICGVCDWRGFNKRGDKNSGSV